VHQTNKAKAAPRSGNYGVVPPTSVFMNPPRVAFSDFPARRRIPRCVWRPEALRVVESRYPLGYFAPNTPAPCAATKAPVAAFSMK